MRRAAVAALIIAAFAVPGTRPGPSPDVQAIAAETDCRRLLVVYEQNHNTWRQGVRVGDDRTVEPNLAAMKAALRRLQQLVDQGRCDA